MFLIQKVDQEIKLAQVALVLGVVASVLTISNSYRQIKINSMVLDKMNSEKESKEREEQFLSSKEKQKPII